MAKVICVLVRRSRSTAIPSPIPATDFPKLDKYPDGQTLPTPKAIDFKPGQLLGSVSGELGLRKFLEAAGHKLVVTSDKDGADSTLDKELPDAEIVISQPFWPAYMTAERIAKAPKLKLIDHGRHRLGPRRSAGRHRAQASPWPKSPIATASAWPSTS